MREYLFRYRVPEGSLSEFRSGEDAATALSWGPIHRTKVLDDGTMTYFGQVDGPPETVKHILEMLDRTIEVLVSGENPCFYFVHFHPSELTREMMHACKKSPLTLRGPFEPQEDGSVIARYVGKEEHAKEAYELIPEEIETEIVHIREQVPAQVRPFASLTDRQMEVLETAVERGYYRERRAATQDDLAEELGVSAGTVGEHLRKIEAKVFSELVG